MILSVPSAPAHFVGSDSGRHLIQSECAAGAIVVADGAVAERVKNRCGVEPDVVISEVAGIDQVISLAEKLGNYHQTRIVAIGGGNIFDMIKFAAAEVRNNGFMNFIKSRIDSKGFLNQVHLENPPLPFSAIPTTIGTGSEVTSVACIQSRTSKTLVHLPGVTAHTIAYDPAFTQGPESLILGGIFEIGSRIAGCVIGSPSFLPLADVEANFIATSISDIGMNPSEEDRLAAALLSAQSHSGIALRGRGIYPSPIWPVANELSAATGLTKIEAMSLIVPPWWQLVANGDTRWGFPDGMALLTRGTVNTPKFEPWILKLATKIKPVLTHPLDAQNIADNVIRRFSHGSLERLDVEAVTSLIESAVD